MCPPCRVPVNTSTDPKLYFTCMKSIATHAAYLSDMKCRSNMRLLSRFRSGCHGRHVNVDIGRWKEIVHLERAGRLCLVCKPSQAVEDEQHSLFGCP